MFQAKSTASHPGKRIEDVLTGKGNADNYIAVYEIVPEERTLNRIDNVECVGIIQCILKFRRKSVSPEQVQERNVVKNNKMQSRVRRWGGCGYKGFC